MKNIYFVERWMFHVQESMMHVFRGEKPLKNLVGNFVKTQSVRERWQAVVRAKLEGSYPTHPVHLGRFRDNYGIRSWSSHRIATNLPHNPAQISRRHLSLQSTKLELQSPALAQSSLFLCFYRGICVRFHFGRVIKGCQCTKR